jgi:hypothetical protein
MKQASKGAPGRCKFCGGTEMSKEHIFGEWLEPLFPGGENRQESIFEGTPTDSINDPTKFRTDKKIPGGVHKKQSRNFCIPCNTVWMHDIVEAVRPLAWPLLFLPSISFPLERGRAITGSLVPNGGFARDISTSYIAQAPLIHA